MATRKEHITRVNELRALCTKKRVFEAIKHFKKNKKYISVRKIAKAAFVSNATAHKYITEYKKKHFL